MKEDLIRQCTVLALAAVAWFYWPFGDTSKILRLPGTVEVQEIRLGSKVGGRVAEVSVAEGDLLQAGQILARFEVPSWRRNGSSSKAECGLPRRTWRRPDTATAPRRRTRPPPPSPRPTPG